MSANLPEWAGTVRGVLDLFYVWDPETRSARHPTSLDEWNTWHVTLTDRIVKQTDFDIPHPAGTTANGFLSTVFLGTDMNFWGGPSLFFETMLFDHTPNDAPANADGTDFIDSFRQRYPDPTTAVADHDRIIAGFVANGATITDTLDNTARFLPTIDTTTPPAIAGPDPAETQ